MFRLNHLSACLGALVVLGGIAGLGRSFLHAGAAARAASPVVGKRTAANKPARSARRDGPFRALDMSRPFGTRRQHFRADRWAAFCANRRREGLKMMVVQARGSKTNNPYADLMLRGAREQGLLTAAYVFLAFDRADLPGDAQVQRALEAVAAERKHLQFFCIDVEGGAAGHMSQAERVNRIGQAIEATTAAGLKPVVYARNTGGHRGEWTDLTGGADDFSYLPLWVPRYDDLAQLNWDTAEGQAWQPFGGWGSRAGKQYSDGSGWESVGTLSADENVFDWSMTAGPARPRPYEVTPLLKLTEAPAVRDPQTGQWEKRVRLTNQSRSPVYAPVSLVLRDLQPGVDLANKTGVAQAEDASGAPYVRVARKQLPPGASVVTTLRFDAPATAPIEFKPVALAGSGDL